MFKNLKKIIVVFIFCLITLKTNCDAAVYSGIYMADANIKNQGMTATVAPGEIFGVETQYGFLFPRENHSIVQIIVGIDGIGAQTCIANGIVIEMNYFDHHSLYFRNQWNDITTKEVKFALTAPHKPGTYAIRYRYAQAYLPEDAIDCWWNVDETPTDAATIGYIVVE